MKKSLILAGVVAALFLTSGLIADDAEAKKEPSKKEPSKKEASKKEPSVWMKQKLKFSQEILNGLATEDYELVSKNALAMKGLNKVEYFVRQKPPAYRTQLKTFQFSIDELIRTSAGDNLDGATLAFTQMTISCVNCHRELRRQ